LKSGAKRRLGYGLDGRRPRFGDPLPETLRVHAAAVIFGGPMTPMTMNSSPRLTTIEASSGAYA
jgi:hypothetical protein